MNKYIKNYFDFVLETKKELKKDKKRSYDFGCLMADIDFKSDIKIKDEDIYNNEECEYGLETEAHITLLYGLHEEVKLKEVKDFIKDEISEIEDIKLTGISFFESKEYDVLKYDVSSKELHKINKKLTKTFPHTTSFPDYVPHLTIGYLKKGKAKQYAEKFKKTIELSCSKVIYSTCDGDKHKISLEKS